MRTGLKNWIVLLKSVSSVARSSLPVQRHRELNGKLFSPGLPGTCLATLWLNPTSVIYFKSKRERHKFTATPSPGQQRGMGAEGCTSGLKGGSTFRSAVVSKILAWYLAFLPFTQCALCLEAINCKCSHHR